MTSPGTRGADPDLPARLTALLEAPVAALGLDLEGVEVTPAGKRRVLRVAVDKDGGVDMDDVAEATRAVSEILDDADVLGSAPYTLEVSSPGVDRPLTLPRHWRRNVGRLVRVTPTDGTAYDGRIVAAEEDHAVLSAGDAEVRVPYAEVRRADIQIEFSRPKE